MGNPKNICPIHGKVVVSWWNHTLLTRPNVPFATRNCHWTSFISMERCVDSSVARAASNTCSSSKRRRKPRSCRVCGMVLQSKHRDTRDLERQRDQLVRKLLNCEAEFNKERVISRQEYLERRKDLEQRLIRVMDELTRLEYGE